LACRECLRRGWLIERVAAHLERQRATVEALLALGDTDLILAVGGSEQGRLAAELDGFGRGDAQRRVAEATAAGLEVICRHADAYPPGLAALEAPPALVYVNGGLERLAELGATEAAALVGTRRATRYGLAAATRIAAELSAAGVTVVSGMAFGIDSAAHEGALQAGGRTVAVLPGSAHRAYPARKAGLFKRILSTGVVLSEVGPAMSTWRWVMQARNRLIAALAGVTVLIEAPERSGAQITVRQADRLGRLIGALPGSVAAPQSAGPNLLLAKGRAGARAVAWDRVHAVRHAQDVLDLLYGEGIVEAPGDLGPAPTAVEAALLARINHGLTNVAMVAPAELGTLTALELKGWVSRGAGGALVVLRAGRGAGHH
jgi:DNA processing protein